MTETKYDIQNVDGLEYLSTIDDNSIDLILTVPPYIILGGFTLEILDKYISQYYKKLRDGGTMIVFFDIWKITPLKNLLEKHNFKQIRYIEWIKTNPQPLNSEANYLTNCRETALTCVKGDNQSSIRSLYDSGIYYHPIEGRINSFHPTQKSLALFQELIERHSLENDVVLDTFMGAGTTHFACINTNRRFKGCEFR